MPPFTSIEGKARTELRPDTDVVIVPDSLAGYFPPIPEPVALPAPVQLAPPPVTLPPKPGRVGFVPIPPAPVVTERRYTELHRWTGSDYLYAGLVAAKWGLPAAIIGIAGYEVATAVYAVAAATAALAVSGVGLVIAIAVVVLLWNLAQRLGSSGPAVAVATAAEYVVHVGAPAKPKSKPTPTVATSVAQPTALVRPSRKTAPVTEPTVRVKPHVDPQTEQWVADLRNPAHGSVKYMWKGGKRGDDRCAVGWLLERTGGQWGEDMEGFASGFQHSEYSAVCDKYGKRFIRKVMRMNDGGASARRIANYVENNAS